MLQGPGGENYWFFWDNRGNFQQRAWPREFTVLLEGRLAMPDDTQTITLMQTPHVNKNVGSLPTFQMRPNRPEDVQEG